MLNLSSGNGDLYMREKSFGGGWSAVNMGSKLMVG